MKGVDIFCSSPASTAICSSMDHRSAVRRGPMPVQRLGHDSLIKTRMPTIPCSSELENIISPRQHYYHQKSLNSTSSKHGEQRRKSSADVSDLQSPRSSRYLLSDTPSHYDILSDNDRAKALVPSRSMIVARNLSSSESPSLRKCSSTRLGTRDQVVELRVSIHCKGCEGKVRKHISRMEGVKSFSIDLVAKKVTVIGDVTPLGVLTSVSRVKNAQFWPSPSSSSSSSTSSSSSYSSSSSSSTTTTPRLRLRN